MSVCYFFPELNIKCGHMCWHTVWVFFLWKSQEKSTEAVLIRKKGSVSDKTLLSQNVSVCNVYSTSLTECLNCIYADLLPHSHLHLSPWRSSHLQPADWLQTVWKGASKRKHDKNPPTCHVHQAKNKYKI